MFTFSFCKTFFCKTLFSMECVVKLRKCVIKVKVDEPGVDKLVVDEMVENQQ